MPIKYNWLGCFYLACQWPSTNSSLRKRYNYCIWRKTRDENFFVNESFQPRFLAENAALPAAASHPAPVADRRPCCTCIDISWPPGPQQQTRLSGGRDPPVCPSVCLSRGPIAAGRAAGLLLSALRAGYIDRQLRAPCSRRRRSAEAARQHGAQQQVQAASRWQPTEEAEHRLV